MKQKNLKIKSNTLFVYKTIRTANAQNPTETTEPTTSMVTTTVTSGIFNSPK